MFERSSYRFGFHHAYEKSYNLRISSISFLLVLLIYYAIIIFHVDIQTFERSPILISLISYAPFVLFPLALKGGYFLYRGYKGEPWKMAVKTIFLMTLYIAIFQGAAVIAITIAEFSSLISASAYYQSYRTLWIAIALFVCFYIVYFWLAHYDLIKWQALNDLKVIPFASPIFCFGMPFIIKNNTSPISLDAATFNKYIILSFFAGLLFIIYILAYAFNNHKITGQAQTISSLIFEGFENTPQQVLDRYVRSATRLCFGLFGIATYLLVLAILDLLTVLVLSIPQGSSS